MVALRTAVPWNQTRGADPKRTRTQKLRRLYEAACRDRKPDRFWDDTQEMFQRRDRGLEDFGLRNLFEQFVPHGAEIVQMFKPGSRTESFSLSLLEAAGEVSTGAFANITGQIVYTEVLAEFENPEFLWPKLMENKTTEFDGEKIPGIGGIGDAIEVVGEGDPYPFAGVSEEWIETPPTIKRGIIVPVTKEAIFFDRTGVLLERAKEVGHYMGVNKEKRCLDMCLGITTSYRRNGGAAQATYGNTHTQGDFDNLQASNALVDWTDIETAELLFDAMTDPNTGEPITIVPKQIVVPTALKRTATRILSATELRYGVHGDTSASTVAVSPGPLTPQLEICTNQYVKNRTSSDTTWFVGDFKRAFKYMENWPAQVTQAPTNSWAEFHRDIVNQYKVSERGASSVWEPRFAVKCTA